jgi:hypothetical protein
MSKWLERLREHEKNRAMAGNGADKTDKSSPEGVSSVLSVRSQRESVNISSESDDPAAAFEERAAILEYDCGLSREEAERIARLQINSTIH